MKKSKSALMLKYQKAKVKLLEYEIPEKQWPNFPLNYRDLAFPTVLVLSNYAEAINDDLDTSGFQASLKYCSDFYDAALQSREQQIHDADFALSAAASYFFMDDLGSAKVLWNSVHADSINNEYQYSLYNVLALAFMGRMPNASDINLAQSILSFWNNSDENALNDFLKKYRNQIYCTDSPESWFWGEIACAIAKLVCKSSARLLLPSYSGLGKKSWTPYFKRPTAINLLWPSQKLVGSSDILRGKNALLQLPTGVGKTRSIELIIWSMLLSKRGNKAIIVAPLRSLCNEISFDVRAAFPQEISINQFSDVLEDDFIDVLLGQAEKQILICTPEKLQYILHHDHSFMAAIDLFIFDESHMFDDPSRGALYELLLTDIKLNVDQKQQLILMSAVLPNADQIKEWLFGNEGILAYDEKIRSTPKAIGFVDKSRQIHYYSGKQKEEDFFVPYTYTKRKLKLLGKERKEKFFPETSRDIALYYANILCKSGGVAIFFNQRRFIPIFLERIVDLNDRGCSFSNLKRLVNTDEVARFQTLYEAYYGKDYIYTKVVQYGVLPHYSTLPNRIRISTEYALKRGYVRTVACTSTLAQGVNIPIRYLLITDTNFSSSKMTVRNFQNLMGRTGRSGVYTEGEIIITSSTPYDERTKRGRGYYRWLDTRDLFDASSVENCGSAILNITKNFEVAYSIQIAGEKIIHFICQNIGTDWHSRLLNSILKALEKSGKIRSNDKQKLADRIWSYKETVDQIENEIGNIYFQLSEEADPGNRLNEVSVSLLENSLAYYLGDDKERSLLRELFEAITKNIGEQLQIVPRYSRTMVAIADAVIISKWINLNEIETVQRSKKELLSLIENLFDELNPSFELKKGLAQSWIQGESYDQISSKYGLKVLEAEKMCQYVVSYQLCFLVGNIIDLCDEKCVNLDVLLRLQQNLRYGVDSKTEGSICEKIFNDRYLAHKIAEIIGQEDISEGEIVEKIKTRLDEILPMLQKYPSYFSNIIANL